MWPFVKKLLQASLLLRELVVDLPNVHRLQTGIAVAGVGLADVYEQVLVKLWKQKCLSGGEPSQKKKEKGNCPFIGLDAGHCLGFHHNCHIKFWIFHRIIFNIIFQSPLLHIQTSIVCVCSLWIDAVYLVDLVTVTQTAIILNTKQCLSETYFSFISSSLHSTGIKFMLLAGILFPGSDLLFYPCYFIIKY